MNCPACGYYNPQGEAQCGHCALPLPVAAAGDAFCAAHPEVKATGACSRCGTFGCGACLTQRGTDWLCPTCFARVGVLPWDERSTLGLWRAWWRTSVALISNPTQTLTTAEPDAPMGSSLLYAMLSMVVGFGPTIVIYGLILIPTMIFGSGSSGTKLGGGLTAVLVPLGVVAYMAFLLVMQVAFMFVLSGIEHLALMVLGANPRSFTVTLRAHTLGTAPYLLGLVPICGLYIFYVWALVLRIIAHSQLHKTSGGKAAAAVLLPVVLFCGCVISAYLAVIGLAVGSGR